MATGLNARVVQLETLGRIEHFDSEGGGRITRMIYCEPYTAHKAVVTALKGTIYATGAGAWGRAKPHADPIFPWFYCTDVQVEPFFPSAVRASPSRDFNPLANDVTYGPTLPQFVPIQTALNAIDDFDGASDLDNLTLPEIQASGIVYPAVDQVQILNTDEQVHVNPFDSRGRCGAKITATYSPLLFQPGLSESVDKFDYVDPQWEPLTISTATGRNLCLSAPTSNWPVVPGSVLKDGLHDSYALPEVVWRFSIRRLMVPFIPARTINLFSNKVNGGAVSIGNVRFPTGTLRMETPEIITRRAPDGNMMHDILLKFLVRSLWDEYWDVAADDYVQGWVSWNHAYCRPAMGWLDVAVGNIPASYYPVVWSADTFPTFGVQHPLFLDDNTGAPLQAIDDAGGDKTGLTQGLNFAPFQAGFRKGQ